MGFRVMFTFTKVVFPVPPSPTAERNHIDLDKGIKENVDNADRNIEQKSEPERVSKHQISSKWAETTNQVRA